MSVLNGYIIDYNLINEFDVNELKTFGFAPIQKDDFLIRVVQTHQADLNYLSQYYSLPLQLENHTPH